MHAVAAALVWSILALATVLPAAAQTGERKITTPVDPQDRNLCFSGGITNAHLLACGRLIASNTLQSGELVRAYFNRAVKHARRGDNNDAMLDDANSILKIEPNNVDGLVLRARGLQDKGDEANARADINRAVRLGARSVLSNNALAVYYNTAGEHDRALAASIESLRLDPNNTYGRKNRGESYENLGEFDKALADYRAVLARDPQETERAGQAAAEGIRRIEQDRAARAAAVPVAPAAPVTQPAALAPIQEALPSTAGAVVPGRRVALVIGNDRYEHLPVLQRAVNDARAVAQRLPRLGFEVILVENGNRRIMNEKIQEMAGRLSPGDTAMFFYAGHGVAIRDTNYLLPVDTPSAREGQESLIAREAISADAVLEAVRERGARVSLMVLDACRDNPFKTTSNTRGIGGTRGLTRMDAAEGVFILYSAGFGQTALDRLSARDADPNSVFTRTFLRQLDRPGLSIQELAKTTQGEVRKLAATVNHPQMPAYYDQIDGTLSLSPK